MKNVLLDVDVHVHEDVETFVIFVSKLFELKKFANIK